jgi:LemA protein
METLSTIGTVLLALGTGAIVGIVIGGLALVIIMWIVSMYNGLVALKNRVKNAWAQIDVQLQRRYDLIPNLVETAKGYMKHEASTLEAVTQARNMAQSAAQTLGADPTNAANMKAFAGAEAGLTGVLGRLMAVAEAYPDLKANENMMQVQEELTTTENKVAFSRQAYNDSVMHFNNGREQFPSNIIASIFNFAEAAMWEVESEAVKAAPKVDFAT